MTTPRPMGLQLYSLREVAAGDLPGTLDAVAAAGFAGVELAGLYGHAPATVRGWLAAAGLAVPSAHAGLQDLETQRRALDDLREVGVDTWVIPSAPAGRFADAAAIRSLADDIHERARLAASLGLRTGYHNHWWELESRIDGEAALVHLVRALDPDTVVEVDIYWAQVGGEDPAALIRRLGPRVELLHVKDGPARSRDDDHVALGTGSVDLVAALAAGEHVRWHIVELDRCATDMLTAIRASARWLTDHGLSTGRS
jgi:sugar phosphate isomerase/epimerase